MEEPEAVAEGQGEGSDQQGTRDACTRDADSGEAAAGQPTEDANEVKDTKGLEGRKDGYNGIHPPPDDRRGKHPSLLRLPSSYNLAAAPGSQLVNEAAM